MYPGAWRKIKEEISIWRVGTLPGMVIIALVIILRFTGAIQSLEWLALDNFLRIRPEEPRDERILLVGINEDDIRSLHNYPISDRDLAALLLKLQSYNPRVIGLDIYRDLPVNPGHTELVAVFQQFRNLIAIEKVLPEQISPPPALPPEQLGFADQILDNDGKLRRILLGTPTPEAYKLSLSLRLAKAYLADAGLKLENGIRDRATMRFGNTELPRFLSNTGGYVLTDAGGVQGLLNFRSGKERFRIVSLRDITSNNFNPDWIRDRIVIIGITASSRKDFITTAAVKSSKPAKGRVYGLEIQAHTVSQIISAVLDSRPLLKTWHDIWEYLWIIAWGCLGIIIAGLTKSPLTNLGFFSLASLSLVVWSYFLLIWGWWVPVIPAIIVLALNSIELTALYQYDFALRSGIQVRQAIIERTFETIHNGPLQSLATVLKLVRSQDLPIEELRPELEKEIEKLNHELRGIYEFLQREPLAQDNSLYLGNSLILNLKDPVHEILYQVYSYTLERDLPGFKTIRVKIRTFEPIDERFLNIELKRGLCRFLEEALCNVGKHATGVTRLEVTCSASEGWYTLSIVDDGLGNNSSKEGRGTQQFRNLERQLKGKFRRVVLSPKGYLCELSWTASKFWWR
ncbi:MULTISPECIES: CHASE2 domain-containing protein [unclassified Nodularia (in: cyanobacteria)]|uniref:CHASE2 domain-containing protein n=1 Tax=unclassified Nodularia (in: cyanobacteria) TaxID=2656917 RepID=UPI001881F8A2|nr:MULTISPECIES: CHASE2 domain-containing protein [unclassified Nodularia (in: cyanobacteria)]MBE9200599.1 CHASE2 domain-containing protein [Nodularia sp. LEGE 06071]MCC2692497.1 CHASE2 domain-containing protein [Nodularia sp. LEGE 04288]